MVFSTVPSLATNVSVKDFGAKGDGKTDDRQAIQDAIDSVNKTGGGIVNFPEGIYLVTAPNKGNWEPQLKLYNNLKLYGVGMFKSIIKVADNQGAWDVILKGDSINGFAMLDLTVDGNGETNPVVSTGDGVKSPYLHTLVYLPRGRNIANGAGLQTLVAFGLYMFSSEQKMWLLMVVFLITSEGIQKTTGTIPASGLMDMGRL